MKNQLVRFVYNQDKNSNPIPPKGVEYSSGFVYLHGEAEKEVGFDIPYSLTPYEKLETGIYPASVNGKTGYTLYFWLAHENTPEQLIRGLIVKNTDLEFKEHAESKYHSRSVGL